MESPICWLFSWRWPSTGGVSDGHNVNHFCLALHLPIYCTDLIRSEFLDSNRIPSYFSCNLSSCYKAWTFGLPGCAHSLYPMGIVQLADTHRKTLTLPCIPLYFALILYSGFIFMIVNKLSDWTKFQWVRKKRFISETRIPSLKDTVRLSLWCTQWNEWLLYVF